MASLLDGPRARGAFLLRVELDPPWAMRIEDRAPLSLVVLTRGAAWLAGSGQAPLQLRPGDVVIALGPAPYVLSNTFKRAHGVSPQGYREQARSREQSSA